MLAIGGSADSACPRASTRVSFSTNTDVRLRRIIYVRALDGSSTVGVCARHTFEGPGYATHRFRVWVLDTSAHRTALF